MQGIRAWSRHLPILYRENYRGNAWALREWQTSRPCHSRCQQAYSPGQPLITRIPSTLKSEENKTPNAEMQPQTPKVISNSTGLFSCAASVLYRRTPIDVFLGAGSTSHASLLLQALQMRSRMHASIGTSLQGHCLCMLWLL